MSMSDTVWQKVKPWVFQAALFLLLGCVFWFGVKPLHEAIKDEMDSIQKLDVIREHKTRQLQRLPELEKQYALIQERGKILDIILTKDELVDFIRTLEELATATGVKITIVSRDNTLLESKVTLPNVTTKKSGGPVVVSDDGSPQDKKGLKPPETMLDQLPLKTYIRLTLTVTADYAAMVAYLHKLETLPYATEIVGVTLKKAIKQREVVTGGDISVPQNQGSESITPSVQPTLPASNLLDTSFDMLVYTLKD